MSAKIGNSLRFALVTSTALSEVDRQRNGPQKPRRKIATHSRRVEENGLQMKEHMRVNTGRSGFEDDAELVRNALVTDMPDKLASAVMALGEQFAGNADVQKGVLEELARSGIYLDQIEGKASPEGVPNVAAKPAELKRATPKTVHAVKKEKSRTPGVFVKVLSFLNRVLSTFTGGKAAPAKRKAKRRVYDTRQVEGQVRPIVEKTGRTLMSGEELASDLQIETAELETEGAVAPQPAQDEQALIAKPASSSQIGELIVLGLSAAALFIVLAKTRQAPIGGWIRSVLMFRR